MKDKKSMIMVIAIGLAICLFLSFNTTVFATTGTVTTGELRLRRENSTSSQIIDLLDENQEVEIIGEDGDWYKVKVNDNIGYVNKQYIKVKETGNIIENNTESSEEKSEENTVVEEENKTEKAESKQEENVTSSNEKKQGTIKDGAKVRIIPLINGDIINTVNTNQEVTIVSNVGLWSYVENDSVSGWVLTQDVSIKTEPITDTNVEENNDKSVSEENSEQEKNENSNEENNSTENETVVTEEKVEVNPETMYGSSKTYYVSGTSVNVRSQASKSSEVVAVLTTNNEVTVTGESGEWYIVSINGTKAYIAKTLLSTTKKEVTSRSSNSVQEASASSTQAVSATAQATSVQSTETTVPETTTTASSSTGEAVVAYAKQFVGYPYVYGANGPNSFDCSGFAQYVYKHFGYSLNRTASAQSSNGVAVSKSNLQPGDLVFFNTSGGISHVGIYIGGDQFVHASTSNTGVIISSLSSSYYQQRYVTARRIV